MQNLIRRIAACVGLHLRRQRTGNRAGPRQILSSARTVTRSAESRIACISYTLSPARTLACQYSLLTGIVETEIASTTVFCRNYKLLVLTCRVYLETLKNTEHMHTKFQTATHILPETYRSIQ